MMRLIRWRKGAAGSDRGAELIELAVVLPILLVVFAAIVDFGFLFQRYEVITNAAREGARLGVLPGYSTTDVQNRVSQYLTASGMNAGAATITVTFNPAQAISPGGPTIGVVDVLVEYPSPYAVLGPIAGLVGGSGWSTINLRAGSNMRTEAQASGS
jgi:Flp pilus assembly protein TadG